VISLVDGSVVLSHEVPSAIAATEKAMPAAKRRRLNREFTASPVSGKKGDSD
jgi:hypothetical protein